MATHSSVLAWRIPGTAKPGGLRSMGSQSRTGLTRLSSSSRSNSQAEVGHSREIVMLVVALLLVVTKMHLEHQMFVKKELDKMLHK